MRSFYRAHRRGVRIALFCAVQIAFILAIVAAFLYRSYLDRLSADGRFSACLLHDALRLYCPGCGGTRAMVALFRGQILHSVMCNPLSAYIAIGFVAFDIRAAIAIARDEMPLLRLPAWYFWIMLAIAIVVFVARNLLLITVGWDYLGDLLPYWHP
jgi:hypothetical protein